MGSVRNFAYAGYAEDDESDDLAPSVAQQMARRRRPSLIGRLFRFIMVIFFMVMFAVFIGLMALIIKPEFIPLFQAQVTNLIQKATGLSPDEIEARRREYSELVASYLPGAKKANVVVQGAPPVVEARLTLSDRLSLALAKRSSVPRERLTALLAQVVTQSKVAGVDPLLVSAMIAVESGFDPERTSDDGKLGLLQLERDKGGYIAGVTGMTWKGPDELLIPTYNLELGIAYIKFLDKIFRGNTRHILMAKSMGARNFINTMKQGEQLPPASVAYADSVLNLHGRWALEFKNE